MSPLIGKIVKKICLLMFIGLFLSPLSVSAEPNQAIDYYNTGIDYYQAGNYAEAATYFTKASELGLAQAQNILADMYLNGRGVKQSNILGIKWMTAAAEEGYALAQSNLGRMYEDGKVVKQNYAVALKWYQKAADQNNAIALGYLGSMYENGHGVPPSYPEAEKWYRKGAVLGDARSQCCLANLYYFGKGFPVNKHEARKWYSKAAGSDDVFGVLAKHMVEMINEEIGVSVPELTGKTFAEAKELIESQQLRIERNEAYSDIVTEGSIIAQNPPADTDLPANSIVTVTVSKGMEKVIVPSVVGLNIATAMDLLSQRKLVGVVAYAYNDYPQDTVFMQSLAPGTETLPGMVIAIGVSMGSLDSNSGFDFMY